jgi:hypothetical protein
MGKQKLCSLSNLGSWGKKKKIENNGNKQNISFLFLVDFMSVDKTPLLYSDPSKLREV